MKRHLVATLGATLVIAGVSGCAVDPTASLRAGVSRVAASLRTVSVKVGDSVAVTAEARDGQGNTLNEVPTFSSATPAVVAVVAAPQPPLNLGRVFLRAVGYGTAKVVASLAGSTDTVTVSTFPAAVSITSASSDVGSGNQVQLTPQPKDTKGQAVTGVPASAYTWSSSDQVRATVDASGLVTGQSPGPVTITVTVLGGATGSANFTVVPGVFNGTLSATSGVPGDVITATRAAGGPAFDADTRVDVNGVRAFLTASAADQMSFVIPGIGQTGAINILLSNMGSSQIAQNAAFTSNSDLFDDPFEPANNDPTTAPVAVNGDQFVILHGDCDQGTATGPTDDCDDFFTVTNNTAADISVTVRLDWFTPADVDILWCNADCSAFVGNFNGATGNNPETSTVTVAPGVTIRLWLNLFEKGSASELVRVRVTGLP